LRRAFFHEQGDMDLMQTSDQESRPLLQRLVMPNVDQWFVLFCFLQHLAITVVPSRTAYVRVRSALPMQIRYHRSAPTSIGIDSLDHCAWEAFAGGLYVRQGLPRPVDWNRYLLRARSAILHI
jgi:hypothetical protein